MHSYLGQHTSLPVAKCNMLCVVHVCVCVECFIPGHERASVCCRGSQVINKIKFKKDVKQVACYCLDTRFGWLQTVL